ncbi:hypothetical protein J41TS12_12010 [Paenibacillus antibioticophila]|uniref:DUF4349 domain-containing protein n=1 Tax=Paenibacillus antibioticophila TaxID=1274374 RepID=A0A920CE80_9BACL|nr:DUF4349 domain-containing protein [Paenibacillus antibioticophila]GIO36340.1 hypothetical protein J41TS12_12010 [Paenibacillus antibioticophila]
MKKKIWFQGMLLLLSLLLMLSGCGSANNADHASSAYDSSANSGGAETESSSMNMAASSSAEASSPAMDKAVTGAQEPQSLPSGSGIPSGSIADDLNKKLIYRANVVMKVEEFSKAQAQIKDLVSLSGGYIVEFSESQSTHEQGGNFVLKVPASGFSSFLEQLEQLKPESFQQSIQGQDVSEEYVDLESRLKVKEAVEARYLKFVGESKNTSDLVQFTNELERIQTEIEQIKGRMRYIDNNVSFSTIEIRVYQTDDNSLTKLSQDQKPLLKRAGNALQGSLEAISVILQWLVIFISGALPVIVIGAVIFAIIWPLRRRRARLRNEKIDSALVEAEPENRPKD